jgi:hypothetical protein
MTNRKPTRRWPLALLPLALCLPLLASAGLFAWPPPPVPPDSSTQDVAGRIIFNGLTMQAQTFRSTHSPKEIVAFYRQRWAGQMVVNQMGHEQVIGHHQGDYFMTVQVSTAGSGSQGNIGVVDLASAPTQFEPGKGLPKPMGSKVFNDILYPDDPIPARMVALQNALSPRQNASFYRERLAGEGWKPLDDHCSASGCVLDYQRGDQKMNLAITAGQNDRSQLVMTIQNP